MPSATKHTMSKTRPLKNIAILGGDEHAWSAAARLLVGLNGEKITLSVIDGGAESLPGVLSLDSSAHSFHRQIGVQEPTLIANAGGCYVYGKRYKTQQALFTYTHSPVGELINRVPFHHYVARLKNLGAKVDFFAHSLAAQAAADNRFTHPQVDSPLEKLDYTMNVDRMRYIQLLRSAVLEHSVQHVNASVVSTEVAENGDIDTLQLSNGQAIPVDFVLDCTGQLWRSDFECWGDFLRYDQRLSWVQETTEETPVLGLGETPTAHSWLIQSALPGGRYFQLSFNTDKVSQHQALALAKQHTGAVTFAPQLSEYSDEACGIASQPWQHNVLSLSHAAGYAGNQLFSELYHTHTALERWLNLYPAKSGSAANALLAKQYNRETRTEYEHVRDVSVLLTRAAAGLGFGGELPKTLAHRIALFEGSGRVAFYESDTLEASQWVNLFIGCGIWPKQTDPLLEALDKPALEKLLRDHAAQTATLAQKLPKHDQLLSAIRNTAL